MLKKLKKLFGKKAKLIIVDEESNEIEEKVVNSEVAKALYKNARKDERKRDTYLITPRGQELVIEDNADAKHKEFSIISYDIVNTNLFYAVYQPTKVAKIIAFGFGCLFGILLGEVLTIIFKILM